MEKTRTNENIECPIEKHPKLIVGLALSGLISSIMMVYFAVAGMVEQSKSNEYQNSKPVSQQTLIKPDSKKL